MVRIKRIVTKFGGTSLENGRLVRKAANSVKDELEDGDTQIAVVVSAMGGMTDKLIMDAMDGTDEDISKKDLDSIMGMGEKISARMFATTLRSLGVEAKAITPADPEWPIITDSVSGDASPDLEMTEEKIREEIVPIMEDGVVPVICGFLGKDESGKDTTIGRGGSDVTAFLVGNCVDATDVILVTDADGVMTANPRLLDDTTILDELTTKELVDLARYGSKIVHHNALKYKGADVNAKVIHYMKGNLSAEGTTIKGESPAIDGAEVEMHDESLAMVTVVGEGMQETPGVLSDSLKPLHEQGINIFGISIGPRSYSIYIEDKKVSEALDLIHEKVKTNETMRSTTVENGVAMIITESEKFIDTPGVISKLSDSLADENLNVIEIYSSQASISFFVDWENREEAYELLQDSVEEVI